MTTKTYDALSKDLLLMAHNPSAMQSLMLNQLQDVQDADGQILLRDPTDPVVYMTEVGITMGHTIIQGDRDTIPKMFPSMAQTHDDLFRHMSDVDYVDVFAQPSQATLLLLLDVDSLLAKAMPLNVAGIRKVVIPRDTVFTVSGYNFAIQYPIEIRVLPYGTVDNPAFQVLWITETQSPISPVTTNALDWELTSVPSTPSQILAIRIPVMQYSVKDENDTLLGQNTFVMTRTFTNKFFYARVWNKPSNSNTWTEIHHTHSRDVYDPNTPTALIQVVNQSIRCTIPSIYMAKNLVSGEIRMDVYTTIGPLDLDVSAFPADEYTFSLRDLNGEYDAGYINPLKSFSIKMLVAEEGSYATGGRTQLSFDELRDRVVNNAVGIRKLPVTEKQLEATVSDYGLTLSKPNDYVTGRTYFLTAPMPESTLSKVSSPIGTITAPLYFSWDELVKLPTVRINGNRLTIEPDTLYRFTDTSLQIDAEMTILAKTMRKEDLVNAGNTNRYLFTPFHYVVDINNKSCDVRIYQLDKPQLNSKRFVSTNVTTELSVVTADYQIEKTSEGYILRTVTKSEPPYQALSDDQVFAQISFSPRNADGKLAYINGTLVGRQGSERVWEFLLKTNLDVDRNDELIINNTRITTEADVDTPVPLLTEYNVFYGCTGYYPGNYERAEMDTMIVPPARDGIGITHEIFKIELGKAMSYYWRKARAVTDSINYEYYQKDVLAYWEKDVIKTKDDGVTPEYTYDPNAVPPLQITYLHRKGDPKIDPATGEQEIAHHVGEQIFDGNGQPIIAKPRSIKFRSEMAVFDARYKFATSKAVKTYLDSVIDNIINYVTVVLPNLKPLLLEQTEGFFVPITTMGYIDVRTEDGVVSPLPAENQFTVKYYLTAANRANSELLAQIRKRTSQVINDYLSTHLTVSATEIGNALRNTLNDAIIGVELDDMGPDKDLRLFTVITEAARATIGKKLDIEANGDIGLKDDIVLSYNRHDTEKE
ncbi:putative virion structural protein [Escherichia phage vB_EcoM_EC001]|uniref:Putative virion structural protein n=2 Tax=root TaxID=1 RepID=A0A7D4YUR1_9CAUD|nr:putative virion structural protein [Escherichia phage vB_EcoM_EC001]